MSRPVVSSSLAITDTVGQLSPVRRASSARRGTAGDDGAHDPVAVAAARVPRIGRGVPAGRATVPAGSRLHPRTWTAYGGTVRFEFAFEKKYLRLAAIGVTPLTARVDVDNEVLDARFGPWHCRTPWATSPACRRDRTRRSRRSARGSLSDRGATFGTTTAGGVCVEFRKPVKILDPSGMILHPG